MSPTEVLAIEEWRPDQRHGATFEPDVEALADVLHAVVYDGAGVSFVVPFSIDDARAFWLTEVLPVSTMCGDDALRDREAEAGAARPGTFVKPIEESRQCLGVHSSTPYPQP